MSFGASTLLRMTQSLSPIQAVLSPASEQRKRASLSLTFFLCKMDIAMHLSSTSEGQVALVHLIDLGSAEPGNPGFH